jgi:glycosyltransferase involved in cell wall biosynthesis
MKDVLVSVVMPVYNSEPFLKEAIDSVLAQSVRDFELILINDGSTDRSEEIIRSYSDPRIRYFFHSNAGVARTLNRGLSLAQGSYIWRHDADDISLPTKLEEELKLLQQNPDIVLCACQVAFMTERGKIAWNYRQPESSWFGNAPFKEVTRQDFAPYSPITHGTVLARRDALLQLDGYRPEFITGEDLDLWLRLIHRHKAVVLNACLSLHRLSANSATKKHGWKNRFFRELSFTYYEQRCLGGIDDLQAGNPPVLPAPPVAAEYQEGRSSAGRLFRPDMLLYYYPLHLDAKDWKGMREILRFSLRDGWRLKSTWRAILFPLMGKKGVAAGVRIKKWFK